MKGRAFIDGLRHTGFHHLEYKQDVFDLLADAVEIADGDAASTLINAFTNVGDDARDWINSSTVDNFCLYSQSEGDKALHYLYRRGLIERHPTKPHLVRFVEAE